MATVTKVKSQKTVLVPEAAAHIVTREIKLTDEQIVKLQAALDSKLPLKMGIGLRSKLWAVIDEKTTLTMAAARVDGEDGDGYCDGDDEIIDEDVQPPDEGGDIPEEEEEEEEQEEQEGDQKAAASADLKAIKPIKASKHRRIVSATIEYYAVAVFRPKFKKA